MEGSTWQLFRALCRSSSEQDWSPPGAFGVWDRGLTPPPTQFSTPNLAELGFSRQTKPCSSFLGVLILKARFGGPHCQGTRAQPPLLPPTFPKHSLAMSRGDWTCWPLSSSQTAPAKPNQHEMMPGEEEMLPLLHKNRGLLPGTLP